MGRAPCCDKKMGLKKGPWTSEEDEKLLEYIKNNGHGSWRSLPKNAGLLRCGKSCRLRWTNYLRPDIKRGPFSPDEEKLVIQLHGILGNRWAAIASQLPGRTDNEVKNLWNTHLRKRLICLGIDPQTHEPSFNLNGLLKIMPASPSTRHMAQWESARLEAEARLSKESLLSTPPPPSSTTWKSDSDFILRMWNSEVGEAFRNFNTSQKGSCQSPASQASSSTTKCGSGSATTTERSLSLADPVAAELEYKHSSRSVLEDVPPGTDSACSSDLEDSSESTVQLLLDYPGANDMSFLGNSDNYLYSGHY